MTDFASWLHPVIFDAIVSHIQLQCGVIITSMLKCKYQLTVQYSLGDGLKTSCRMVVPGAAAVAWRQGWAMFLLHSRLHPVLL